MKHLNFYLQLIALIALLLFLNGCSSTNSFKNYTDHLMAVKGGVEDCNPMGLYESLGKGKSGDDKVLYYEESGRLAYLEGDIELSKENFESAAKIMDNTWADPDVNLKEFTLSTFFNDNAIAYKGNSFEKILIHTYQALNYLSEKDIEGAGVELRRADFEQRLASDRHWKEIEITEEIAASKNLNLDDQEKGLMQWKNEMAEVSPSIKSSFLNAFTYYLSGVIWEKMNDFDNALVAYKKSLDLYPNNSFVRENIRRLHMQNNDAVNNNFSQKGRVIVIYEYGFAPQKRPFAIPIVIPNFFKLLIKAYNMFSLNLQTISVPVYPKNCDYYNARPLCIELNSDTKNTETICSIRDLAIRELEENYKMILTRQLIRFTAKMATNQALSSVNPFLGVGVEIFNNLTECADLRSWLTLPDSIQIAEFWVDPGEYCLKTNSVNNYNEVITVENNGLNIIRLTEVENASYVKMISL